MSKGLFISFLFLCFLCLGCSEENGPTSSGPIEQKLSELDYQVFADLFKNTFISDPSFEVCLYDSTDHHDIATSFNEILEETNLLEHETLIDYQNKSKIVKIDSIPGLQIQCHLITKEDCTNWSSLYPESFCIIYLSRIGYNSEKDQAILYMAIIQDSTTGAGFLYFMEKEEEWTINSSYLVWIS